MEADIVVVDAHRRFVTGFRLDGWLIVPESVRWRRELSELPPGHPSKSLRSDMAKLRKHGYEGEEGATAADWREFFEHMLLPHARNRFEERAQLPTQFTLKQLQDRGQLLFVRRNGIRVAGGCVLPVSSSALFERLGVRDGSERLLREGALSALYLHAFEWARGRGFEWFDAGTTLPFPDDGLARFKTKFGLLPEMDPFAFTTAFLGRRDAALEIALARRPVFHLKNGRVGVMGGDGAR